MSNEAHMYYDFCHGDQTYIYHDTHFCVDRDDCHACNPRDDPPVEAFLSFQIFLPDSGAKSIMLANYHWVLHE